MNSQKIKKLALDSGIQTNHIWQTMMKSVIPRLSSIFLAVHVPSFYVQAIKLCVIIKSRLN